MLNAEQPLVTVLMPVYNGEAYLQEAIESILQQTYRHIELLIINDGSTDRSSAIVESFNDPRIRLVHNPENLGIVRTLNKGIAMAQGKYIARMDCDDISVPTRIERQIAFMEQHADIGICAGNFEVIQGRRNASLEAADFDPLEVEFRLLFYCCLAHPTILMRREAIEQHRLCYRSVSAEDYDLWVRAAGTAKIYKMSDIVLKYRDHGDQLTKTNAEGIHSSTERVIRQQLELLGITPSDYEMHLHHLIASRLAVSRFKRPLFSQRQIKEIMAWLTRLDEQNNRTHIYDIDAFHGFINRLKSELTEFEARITELKKRATSHQLYLFGSGRIGETYLEYLNDEGIRVAGFLDNSQEKWGKVVQGIPIHPPAILMDETAPYIVIATSIYADDILESLESMKLRTNGEFLRPLY